MAHGGEFVTLSVVILAFVCVSIHATSAEDDFLHCQSIVQNWAAASLAEEVKENKHILQDLLFFLHIPRTGGRTYFYCFLKKLYTSYLECPRSYDKLHFDPSKPNCRLMATHDDYSLMSKLPKERTSVITILRNPVDRVFSTYEFSVEVAARFLVHPNLTSVTQMNKKVRSKGVSTLDIWPWKYLVPWMREDLFARRDARKPGDFTDIKAKNNSYNMEEIVMPLYEFINDVVAHDIIHNGATFQIAGLTNNSCLEESHEVRRCVRKYQGLGKNVLEVAKKRLDNMLYVGLTEEHKESATVFANVVGKQVFSQLQLLSSSSDQTVNNKTELNSSILNSKPARTFGTKERKAHEIPSAGNAKTTNETMTVKELMEVYETCVSTLRKTQARRRAASFKRISPTNFSKEARLQVPEVVLQKIISLNSLDMELYKHAQDIFRQQKSNILVQKLVKVQELQEDEFKDSYGPRALILKCILLTITVLFLLVLLVLLVSARNRKLKVRLRKWLSLRR